MTGPPPECRPIHAYKWIHSESLLMSILMHTMPWLNWPDNQSQIIAEIMTNSYIQYAFAKSGIWIKYFIESSYVSKY